VWYYMQMERPRTENAVIMLDYDGVIADSFDVYYSEFGRVCARLGLRRLYSRETYLKLYDGGRIKQWVWERMPLWLVRGGARMLAPIIEVAEQRVQPFDGMPEVVRNLSQRWPVYVITANTTQATSKFLARHAIEGVVEVIGADKIPGKVKKMKKIIREHPDRVPYYVGDTLADMRNARRAGAVPLAATWGWHSAAQLLETRPECLLESPAALEAFFIEKTVGTSG